MRHPELPASELVLWEPCHGRRDKGRPHITYIDTGYLPQPCIDTLKTDTGLGHVHEIQTLMEDRDQWRNAIHNSRVGVGWRPRIASSHHYYKGFGILHFFKIADSHHLNLWKILIWYHEINIINDLSTPNLVKLDLIYMSLQRFCYSAFFQDGHPAIILSYEKSWFGIMK